MTKKSVGVEPAPQTVAMWNAVGWPANVPADQVETWEAAGWTTVKPKEAGEK
jgi:hypothetical protein